MSKEAKKGKDKKERGSAKHVARRPPEREIRISDKLAKGNVKTTSIKLDKDGEITSITRSENTKSKPEKLPSAFTTTVEKDIERAKEGRASESIQGQDKAERDKVHRS